MFAIPYVSRVACHKEKEKYIYIGKSGGARRSRACYQRGLPRLVFNLAPYVIILFQVKKFNSGGKHALLRHANTLVHKRIADGRKNRLDRQRPLAARSVAVDVNDNTGGEEGGRRKEGEVEGDPGQQEGG